MPAADPVAPWLRRLAAGVAAVLVAGAAGPARAGDVQDWANSMLSGCWSCAALGQMVQIGLGFAGQAFTTLAAQVADLVGLCMAIWIVFFAGRMFLPFGVEGGAGSLWNRGAKKLLQFAVLLVFLQNGAAFWDYVFIPIMSAGMEFSKAIVTLSDPLEAANGTSQSGPSSTSTPTSAYCTGGASGDGVNGAVAVMQQMNCPLAAVQSQFGKGVLVGVVQISQASKDLLSVLNFSSAIAGLVLLGVYFMGLVLFPIFMVDVVMRLTIVTTIAPVALAAALFGPTKRLAEKALWQIAQAALTLVFVSIVAGLGKATLAYVFSHLTANGGAPDWNALIQILETQKTQNDTDFYVSLTTMVFYQLLAVGVILLFMLRQAGRMAGEFTGAGGGDFSGALAGVAAMTGTAVHLATSLGLRTAGRSGGRGGSGLAQQVSGAGGGEDPAAESG